MNTTHAAKTVAPPARPGLMSRSLGDLWDWWKRTARKIGDLQARIFLTVFYFVVFGPFALCVRWASDPLAIKTGAPRGWRSRTEAEGAHAQRAQRQF